MTFINPLVLIGLTAAAIPILLHLLNLRKLHTIDFSSLRFLKELQKTRIRRLKIKQIILLILRTLIIIFIVLAFSRPTIDSSLPYVGGYAKSSAIILLDNSFSMDVSDEYGNRFKQAKDAAMTIFNGLKESDETAIIPMTNEYNSNQIEFSRNLSLMKQDLNKYGISIAPANLESSLRIASELIKKSNNVNKEIFIITDAQNNIFVSKYKDSLNLFGKGISVYFIPIGLNSKSAVQNYSIDSLNIITKIFRENKPAEFDLKIRNSSDKDIKDLVVSLFYNNNRVAQRTADIPANDTRNYPISAQVQSKGLIRGYVELEDDQLLIDNKRYFSFLVPESPEIALLGSKEKTKFISIALGSVSEVSQSKLHTFSTNDFAGIDPAKYDILIFTESPTKDNDWIRIRQYISNGGSCLIFADEDVNFEFFKNNMKNLGFGDLTKKNFSSSQPASFTNIDKLHPIFEGVFKGTTDSKSIVESPKIQKAITVNSGSPIIEMQGASFLSENRYNDGKVIYCAVSPVLSWSNFPVTGLFPALIYRSVAYLSTKQFDGNNFLAENPVILNLPRKFSSGGNFKIVDPNGTESYRQAVVIPAGAILSFEPFTSLGSYVVKTTDDQIATSFSINTDPTESYLKSYSKKDISNYLKSKSIKNFEIIDFNGSNSLQAGIQRARTGTELWQFFIVLALLCIIAEMLVAKNSKNDTEA